MNYQSNARNLRPKGFKVKHAVQFVLLLACCIWLVYQIKHSHDQRRNNGASMQSKLSEKHGDITLGRKGNAGWSSSGGESGSEDANLVREVEKKEDGGVGDDELDRNVEEKAEEESYNKDNNYGHGNVASRDTEDQKKHETQYEEFQSIEDNIFDTQVGGVEAVSLNKDMYKEEYSQGEHEIAKRSVPDNDEKGDEKEPETQIEEPQNSEKNRSTLIQDKNKDKDEADEENDEDEGPSKIEEKTLLRPGGIFNTSFPIQHEVEDDFHGFQDENGIPQYGSGIIESIPTWSAGDHKDILSRRIISSSDNQSGIIESMAVEGEIVETIERSSTADAETENKSILEESKNEETADAKIDAETSVASGIDHASETIQGKSIILEDSHSVSSQQEQEAAIDNSMFPQAE